MPKVWGFTQAKEFWEVFFSTPGSSRERMPLLWTCGGDQEQKMTLTEYAQIYDPFLGISIPGSVVTCLGVLATQGYESSKGYTVELMPKELIPNPIPLATLVKTSAFPQDVVSVLAEPGCLRSLESSQWACFKKVLATTNPQLASYLVSLENWRQRQEYLDHILDVCAQHRCTDEEEQEVFAVLRTLVLAEPENPGSSGPLDLQKRLRAHLKAQLLPDTEWQKLWKSIIDSWYGYVLTLTSQEVARLTDLSLTYDL
ncbi:MAG: hypothetical protein AMJ92_05660 [candidate division Zixibacteria bacterium SM23_81]|nr:MAG: hypothetical protein AMJ92_05660 [candidate division Zixibacteria bacterium SM23_81]